LRQAHSETYIDTDGQTNADRWRVLVEEQTDADTDCLERRTDVQ